jgi:hypothetical protein
MYFWRSRRGRASAQIIVRYRLEDANKALDDRRAGTLSGRRLARHELILGETHGFIPRFFRLV